MPCRRGSSPELLCTALRTAEVPGTLPQPNSCFLQQAEGEGYGVGWGGAEDGCEKLQLLRHLVQRHFDGLNEELLHSNLAALPANEDIVRKKVRYSCKYLVFGITVSCFTVCIGLHQINLYNPDNNALLQFRH